MAPSMGKTKILTDAMHVEKDNRVYARIMAVRSVLLDSTTAQTAEIAGVTQRTVQMWIKRFDLAALTVYVTPLAGAESQRFQSAG